MLSTLNFLSTEKKTKKKPNQICNKINSINEMIIFYINLRV